MRNPQAPTAPPETSRALIATAINDGSAIVVEKAFRGADFLYYLRMDSGIEVMCLAPSHHNHRINERIGVRLDVDHLVIFPRG